MNNKDNLGHVTNTLFCDFINDSKDVQNYQYHFDIGEDVAIIFSFLFNRLERRKKRSGYI